MNNAGLRDSFEFISDGEEGILLLHGFTGTPYEMMPAGEFFRNYGYSSFCPRLKGHGTTEEDLNSCRFYDWIESAEKGLNYLKKKVKNIHILGLSMGGLLALKLASVHKEVKKVVVVASPLYLTGENGLFVTACRIPFFRFFVKSVRKPEPSDERYRCIWRENPSYRSVPTKASYEFFRLMQNVKKSLKDVRQSTMFVYSKGDRDVDFSNLNLMISLIGSRDIVIHTPLNMGHLITLEDGNQEVFSKILKFLKR